MSLPFLYSDADAESFLDELLDPPDGWFQFVEQHRAWGFDDDEIAAMIRDRSKGKYRPTVALMRAMHSEQRPRDERVLDKSASDQETPAGGGLLNFAPESSA